MYTVLNVQPGLTKENQVFYIFRQQELLGNIKD